METEIALTSIVVLVLVVVATAKSALDELSDVALRLLASEKEDSTDARFWRSILNHHHQLSFTLTFGIHLSIASIAILLSSIAHQLYPEHFLAIAFSGMILTVIIFRQILPLIITQNDPTRTLLKLRVPLRFLWPALGAIAHPIYRSLRGLQRDPEAKVETEDKGDDEDDASEIQALLEVGEEEGIIEENEGEMIQSIIRFGDRTAGEVMTPRTNMAAVEANTMLEQVRDLMIESKYSRLPVYRDSLDNIEGVIYVRDLIKYWQSGSTNRKAIEIARPTYFIPETKPIDELLPEMQKAKTPMAIVIDEYGGLAGLVTIEDLIEEIVGEIEDEDEPEPQAIDADIFDESYDTSVVRGQVEVAKIERRFDVELAADDFTTVAGLVLNRLGHLPSAGESIEFKGLKFEVLEADERRVSRVRVQKLAQLPEAEVKQVKASAAVRGENDKNSKT
jgi:magnesium and cobalt exporter, CNNM family